MRRATELRNRTSTKKIYLSHANKEEKLAFAQQFVNQSLNIWDRVIFSDENIFQSIAMNLSTSQLKHGIKKIVHGSNQSGCFSLNLWT